MTKPSFEITDEEADYLIPRDIVNLHIENVQTTKAQYLEKMAAAFVLETRIPITECELVQQTLPHPQVGWRFFYRIRKD